MQGPYTENTACFKNSVESWYKLLNKFQAADTSYVFAQATAHSHHACMTMSQYLLELQQVALEAVEASWAAGLLPVRCCGPD